MKKVFLAIFFLIFLPKAVFAQETWKIDRFNTDIAVNQDGKINVQEEIAVDFDNLEKHGIYRDLPYVYDENGKIRYTEVAIGEILQDGKRATTKVEKNENNLRIRIGDADRTINGKHTYQINYTVNGILRSFDDHDELYWNTTGNDWEVPILSATATLSTPIDAINRIDCFEGPLYSTDKCLSELSSSRSATFSSTQEFSPGSGMTIVAGFDKGVFPIAELERPPSFLERVFSSASAITFILALVAGIFFVIRQWFSQGRDFWIRGIGGYKAKDTKDKEIKPIGANEPVIVEYTPPEKLTPALVGVLVDERADTLDVSSTIIDLASRGYLTITEIPKKWIFGKVDYTLKDTGKNRTPLMAYEKELLSGIFTTNEVKMSELQNKFYKTLVKVKEKLYQEAVDRKFFPESPEKTRTKYYVIGIVALSLSIGALVFSIASEIVFIFDIALAALLSSFVLLILARFMPRRTALGREMYRRIKGYRLFIDRAENYRQKFFEKKNIINEILPYAIIFGLTAQFAKTMEKIGIETKSPTWYHGTGIYTLSSFSDNVSSFSNSLSTAIASTPSSSGFSSGGGFSGGGGGGGGGGSW